MPAIWRAIGLAALLALAPIGAAYADLRIRLHVDGVVDGDTFDANGERWRPLGYDAPETTRRTGECEAELELGRRAKTFLEGLLLAEGARVEAAPTFRRRGGYERDVYGRVLARVWLDGEPIERRLYREGFAKPWDGKRETRPDWCEGRPRFNEGSPGREGG